MNHLYNNKSVAYLRRCMGDRFSLGFIFNFFFLKMIYIILFLEILQKYISQFSKLLGIITAYAIIVIIISVKLFENAVNVRDFYTLPIRLFN